MLPEILGPSALLGTSFTRLFSSLVAFLCLTSSAFCCCEFSGNAVVVAEKSKIIALNLEDGSLLWSGELPSPAVSWGLAVDCNGRVVVSLENGSIQCFARTAVVSR